MKDAKFIRRGLTPCFFAISAARLLKASICGSACLFAASYVSAPWQSHILMLFNAIVLAFISNSLCSDITAGRFFLQGERKKYFKFF